MHSPEQRYMGHGCLATYQTQQRQAQNRLKRVSDSLRFSWIRYLFRLLQRDCAVASITLPTSLTFCLSLFYYHYADFAIVLGMITGGLGSVSF